ncbi:hypothetical protein BU17DRAFT_102422 [Hysterangium stoloniferum]|nr:hypothetical protein BU17DRAFT_102422 [Hysterangium stoloniferum]
MLQLSQSSTYSSSEYESAPTSDYDNLPSDESLFDKTELSATQLAESTEHFAIWELLHGCQEAAFEDIPLKYKDCLAVFDVNMESYLADEVYLGASQYDGLFALAGAVKTSDPWSLSAPIYDLSIEDAMSPLNMQVLAVSQVQPTAACFIPLDKGHNQHKRVDSAGLPVDSNIYYENASPLVHPKRPAIASAVFLSADIIGHDKPSFNIMWRYNRLATTSLMREACSLGIDVPILGILLRDNLVAIHIDWYEEKTEDIQFNSAFIPSQPEEMDIRTWDLSQPQEARAFASILSNLRQYTWGTFATTVNNSVRSCSLSFKPWKWNSSVLRPLASSMHLDPYSETGSKDKVVDWMNRLPELSCNSETVWVKQKLVGWEIGLDTNILSPPSTPPGDN